MKLLIVLAIIWVIGLVYLLTQSSINSQQEDQKNLKIIEDCVNQGRRVETIGTWYKQYLVCQPEDK